MAETPIYIKQLLIPNGAKKTATRRIWGIELENIWLPFLTATNTMGDTAIPSDALGAPLRSGYNQDGTVKFSKTGRPVMKVAKDIADSVRLIRDNFTAGLVNYAGQVATDNPDGFKAQVLSAQEAGQPIVNKDRAHLAKAMQEQVAEALASADNNRGRKREKVPA